MAEDDDRPSSEHVMATIHVYATIHNLGRGLGLSHEDLEGSTKRRA